MKKLNFLFVSLVMAFAIVSCDNSIKDPILSTSGFEDFEPGDAAYECAQVGCDGDYSFKIEEYFEGTHVDEVSGNIITISSFTGESFSWTSEFPVCAVIVKAGTGVEVYYPSDPYGGTGLTSPINPNNGKPYGISHISFCFNEPELPELVFAAKSTFFTSYGGTYGFTEFGTFRFAEECSLFPTITYIPLDLDNSGPIIYDLSNNGNVPGTITVEIINGILTLTVAGANGNIVGDAHIFVGTVTDLISSVDSNCNFYVSWPASIEIPLN